MKSILKTMIYSILLVAGFCSCEKLDMNKLEGTRSEQYDPTVFATLATSLIPWSN